MEKNKKQSFETLEHYPADRHCYYSGLPSPQAYEEDSDDDNTSNQGKVPVLIEKKKKGILRKFFSRIFKSRKKPSIWEL